MSMNKKLISGLACLVALAGLAYGQGQRIQWNAFSGSGTATNTTILVEGSGKIVIEAMSYTLGSPAQSSTLKFFRPFGKALVNASTAAATTNLSLVIDDTTGKIKGYLLAASDYLILADTSTNVAGYQLRKVAAVGAITTNGTRVSMVTQLVVSDQAGTASVASNDVAFVVKATDIMSRTVTAAANGELYPAVGYDYCPLGISLTTTATAPVQVSGSYGIWR